MSKSCTCILCGSPCAYTGLAYSENCSNSKCKFAAVDTVPADVWDVKVTRAGWTTNAPVRFVEKFDTDLCVRQLKEIALHLFKDFTFSRASECTTVYSDGFVRADHVSYGYHAMNNPLMSNDSVRKLLNIPDPYEYVTLKTRAKNENT